MSRPVALISFLAALLGLAAPAAAQAPGLRTAPTLTSPWRPTPALPSGQLQSTVIAKHERRYRVSVSVVVQARRAATLQLFVTGCTTVMYRPCRSFQRAKQVRLHAGRNRVRWKLTVSARSPINSIGVTAYDLMSASPSATTHHIVRG